MPIPDPRSPCPVACTLDILGDRWTLLVIRDLFLGKARFSDFQKSPEGIATNILSARLALLVDAGLADKTVPDNARRAEYRLTDKGRSLHPVLKAVADWGLAHLEGTDARLGPIPAP